MPLVNTLVLSADLLRLPPFFALGLMACHERFTMRGSIDLDTFLLALRVLV